MADRKETVVLAAVLNAAGPGNKIVRLSAIEALARVGNVSCLSSLLDSALEPDAELSQTAKATLYSLPGDDVDQQIVSLIPKSREKMYPLLLELIKGEYLDQRENILLVGPSGTGKSHLATALGMTACSQGRKVRFFRVTELITLLLEAKEERQLLRLRQQLGKLDLLILDELGYVPASKAGAELLFDVIATAYERYSLIVTTNLPFENWTEVLGSERLTGAALDRLTHRCHILETKGESYRLQDAKRRRRRNG